MEDMDMVLATPDMLDTHMPMVPMDTMERDLLMLSQRLMLILLSSTELMVLATDITVLAMLDMDMDTHMLTMERDLLMLSQRLMLIPLSSMELTHMLDLDTAMDMLDTHMSMERDLLMLSQRLMLLCIMVDTTDMPDLMPMVLDTEDTTTDKSQTHFKNSTKQKLKANNILL